MPTFTESPGVIISRPHKQFPASHPLGAPDLTSVLRRHQEMQQRKFNLLCRFSCRWNDSRIKPREIPIWRKQHTLMWTPVLASPAALHAYIHSIYVRIYMYTCHTLIFYTCRATINEWRRMYGCFNVVSGLVLSARCILS